VIRYATIRWLLVAVIAAALAYWLTGPRGSESGLVESPGETPPELALQVDTLAADAVIEGATDSSVKDEATCLTAEQLEYHPLVVEDAYRYDAVGITGPSIGSYRGLSTSELRDLADQGDSAAMAVLGAAKVMQSRGLPVSKAVSYLLLEEPRLLSYRFKRPISAESRAHLEQAREWFYKAALHGRVMALYKVGESFELETGGPVELGWIAKDEYEALSSYEQMSLLPSNLYNALAFKIAPELGEGPHGEIFTEIMPRSDKQQALLGEFANRFFEDLDAAGLPPISVPDAVSPSFDELKSLLCSSELERLERSAGTPE